MKFIRITFFLYWLILFGVVFMPASWKSDALGLWVTIFAMLLCLANAVIIVVRINKLKGFEPFLYLLVDIAYMVGFMILINQLSKISC